MLNTYCSSSFFHNGFSLFYLIFSCWFDQRSTSLPYYASVCAKSLNTYTYTMSTAPCIIFIYARQEMRIFCRRHHKSQSYIIYTIERLQQNISIGNNGFDMNI